MENLAPPLNFILHLRSSLERGETIQTSCAQYCAQNADTFSISLTQMLSFRKQGLVAEKSQLILKNNPYRQQLLMLVERGLAGESIYQQLVLLEEEFKELANLEIEEYISRLPVLSLLPLTLLIFPGFLILLFGPLLKNFFSALGRF